MNRKNLILGGILVILIALAYFYQGPFKDWRANLGKPANFLNDLSVGQIDRIDVGNITGTTSLEKAGDKWKIAGTKEFYLNDATAAAVVNQLAEAAKANVVLVSENKDKKDDFDTGITGTRIILKQGGKILADFIIGKMGSDYASTYMAEPGSNETYSIKANLYSAFVRSDWYDKTIFKSDKDKIVKIRFQYPTREFTIEKKDDVWSGTLPVAFKVNAEKISKILDIISNLTAADIPAQTFAGTGLEKNGIIIQASGDGVDNTLMVGDKNGDGFYFAKRGNSDNIYLITEEQRNELDKRTSDLK